jgi:tRNA modification GTPase
MPVIRISAATGDGLAELEEAISSLVSIGGAVASDAMLVSNPRHKDALTRALVHLQAAKVSLKGGLPSDFIAIDLTSAIEALGEITGETVAEDLLESIFSKFCIGK